MNNTIAIRFRLSLACVCLLILAGASYSASAPDELYRTGKSAFDRGDYLSAVKYLFAYSQATQISGGTLATALSYAEEEVMVAVRTKAELDRYGTVTKIHAQGKADGREVIIPVQLPISPQRPKPAVSATPPSTSSDPAVRRSDIYARIAIAQNEANLANRCGFTGGRWTSNYQTHFSWCQAVSDADSKAETAERQRMLDECAR